jgi:hypothetical protein
LFVVAMGDSFHGNGAGNGPGEIHMRFMFIITSAQAAMPTPGLMEAIGELADREIKAGRMIDNGGLAPLATGARVTVRKARVSVIDGPFIEAREIIGGYAVFELASKEEALAAATEFMQLHTEHMPDWEGTCEVRAMVGSHTADV